MSSVIEGWYVDPSTGTNLRFWNGYAWTDEVCPLPDTADRASATASVHASPPSAAHGAAHGSAHVQGRAPKHGATPGDGYAAEPTHRPPRHAL